jgi:ribonuclease HI
MIVNIFTDGSVIGYKKYARGGIGAVIDYNDRRIDTVKISEPFFNYPITAPRTEFYAIIRSLIVLLNDSNLLKRIKIVNIYSDNNNVQMTMNEWIHAWRNRGWKKYDGSEPENLDLIQYLDFIRNLFAKKRKEVNFYFVKGHRNRPKLDHRSAEYKIWDGNRIADLLAKKGTNMAIKYFKFNI